MLTPFDVQSAGFFSREGLKQTSSPLPIWDILLPMLLGMIIVDYIQLMTGRGRFENRTLELASISRSLKGLAKELAVPIIVLSQLSRAPEARSDKRPMLSDLRESGCLTADTRVMRADTGAEIRNPVPTVRVPSPSGCST